MRPLKAKAVGLGIPPSLRPTRTLLALQQSPSKEAVFLPRGRKILQGFSWGLQRHRVGELMETLGLAACAGRDRAALTAEGSTSEAMLP